MTQHPIDHVDHDGQPLDDCWRRIGTGGDRTCPELATVIHCRNCPVVSEAARRFFDRPAPAGYLDGWRDVLEQADQPCHTDARTVLVFRIGGEWLGLPASALAEVVPPRRVHRLPHRVRGSFAGIVNVHGRLEPCVHLSGLLGLDEATFRNDDGATARMLVVERAGRRGADRWVLDVDEVGGLAAVAPAALRDVPSTVGRAVDRATAALFSWRDRTVGLLDEHRLFESLRIAVAE